MLTVRKMGIPLNDVNDGISPSLCDEGQETNCGGYAEIVCMKLIGN